MSDSTGVRVQSNSRFPQTTKTQTWCHFLLPQNVQIRQEGRFWKDILNKEEEEEKQEEEEEEDGEEEEEDEEERDQCVSERGNIKMY